MLEGRRGEFRYEPPANVPGGAMVFADATWEECTQCGERIFGTALNARIEREAGKRWGLLSPEQIRAIREKAGLTQAAMAFWLGVGEKTYTRWEAGKSYQNKSSDNLIRLFDQNPELLARFEAQRRPDRPDLIRGYMHSLQRGKGENALSMAAHEAEIDEQTATRLRERLKRLAGKPSE